MKKNDINIFNNQAKVTFDDEVTDPETIMQRLKKGGYPVRGEPKFVN